MVYEYRTHMADIIESIEYSPSTRFRSPVGKPRYKASCSCGWYSMITNWSYANARYIWESHAGLRS